MLPIGVSNFFFLRKEKDYFQTPGDEKVVAQDKRCF